jgi:hypothetical protein
MRLIVAVSLLCISYSAKSQWLPIHYDTITARNEIILSGNAEVAGSAILNEISSVFFKGGNISGDMIQRSLDRHGAVNRLGVDISSELVYRNYTPLVKKYGLGYQIKAGSYYFGGMLYTRDLFDLAMNGNSGFEGDTADFSGSDFSFTAFQKIGFGLVSARNGSSVSLNFYNIQNRIDFTLRDGQFINSNDFDSIQVLVDGEYSGKSSQRFDQGLGFGIDLEYYMPFQWGSGKTSFVEFKAANLGFGIMTKDQDVYRMDTSITYSGFRFDQLFGDDAIVFDSVDVLDTLGVKTSSSKRAFLLPGFLQVAKIVDEKSESKFQSFFGLRVYPTLIYNPLAFAGIDFKPAKGIHVGLSASYGGFTKFRTGLYASGAFGNFRIGLGSENIIGVFSQKGNGASLNFRLSCVF